MPTSNPRSYNDRMLGIVGTGQIQNDGEEEKEEDNRHEFHPEINPRSVEIANRLKRPPVYLRYKDEIKEKKENLEYLSRKVEEEREMEREKIKIEAEKARTLSSSRYTRDASREPPLPLYEKNMDWLNKKNSRMNLERYQSHIKLIDEENNIRMSVESRKRTSVERVVFLLFE